MLIDYCLFWQLNGLFKFKCKPFHNFCNYQNNLFCISVQNRILQNCSNYPLPPSTMHQSTTILITTCQKLTIIQNNQTVNHYHQLRNLQQPATSNFHCNPVLSAMNQVLNGILYYEHLINLLPHTNISCKHTFIQNNPSLLFPNLLKISYNYNLPTHHYHRYHRFLSILTN